MALNATLGMAAIIITNKVMMPIMLTWVDIGDPVAFQEKQDKRDSVFDPVWRLVSNMVRPVPAVIAITAGKSEEHTSELQSLMRISSAVFCLNKKTKKQLHIRKDIEIRLTANCRNTSEIQLN